MASKFTEEDLKIIKEAASLLNSKIVWSIDPGGWEARAAYEAIGFFLGSPAVRVYNYCVTCGQPVKK